MQRQDVKTTPGVSWGHCGGARGPFGARGPLLWGVGEYRNDGGRPGNPWGICCLALWWPNIRWLPCNKAVAIQMKQTEEPCFYVTCEIAAQEQRLSFMGQMFTSKIDEAGFFFFLLGIIHQDSPNLSTSSLGWDLKAIFSNGTFFRRWQWLWSRKGRAARHGGPP